MNTKTATRTARMAVVLDPKAKAKVTRPPVKFRHEPAVMRARATCASITRTPDVIDDTEVVWFGDTFAVVVPLEHLDTFRSYIHARGLSTCGRGTYRIEHLTYTEVTWARLYDAVRP